MTNKFLHQKSLSGTPNWGSTQVNASRMAVSNQNIGSFLPLKFFATFLVLFAFGIGSVWGANQDISLSSGSNDDTNKINTWTATNICTIKQEAGGAQNETPPANYLGTPRWYKSNIITFTAASGIELNSVVVTCTTEGYASTLAGSTYTRTGGSGSVAATAGTGTNSAKVTITCTGTVTAFTISMGGQARLSAITVNYTSATPAQKYTVTLMDDTEHPLTESTVGGGVTLPARGGCDGYTFAGWTSSWGAAQTTWTTTAPTIIPAGSYHPSADVNLYPVYTKTEGGSGFTLSLTSGNTEYYVGAKGSGAYLSAVTNAANAVTFTYEDGLLSFDNSGTKTYISSAGDNTTLTIGTDEPDVTWTESGTTSFSYQSSATGNRYLAFNGSANPVRFAPYGSTFAHEFTKHSASTTSYISVPNCCTSLAQINGSVFVSHTILKCNLVIYNTSKVIFADRQSLKT